MKQLLAIFGAFFEDESASRTQEDPLGTPPGEGWAIRTYGFYGTLNVGEEGGGQLTDEHGKSTLSDVAVGERQLTFTKKYKGREDVIKYTLQQGEDGIWKGRYHGSFVGEGEVKCILTPIPENFMEPDH